MSLPHSELDALGPLAEAFLSRYRSGERPSVTEYTEKYPDLAEQIREVFPALVVMEELGAVEEPQMASTPAAVPAQSKVPERLGDYRILREVGRGGMGIVYEAVQESLGRHVALKVLPFHGQLSPTHLERFRREARAAARLHHTNIVPVHGVGEHEGFHFYAMQFIQGQGLDELLREVKRLRVKKVVSSTESPGSAASLSKSELATQSEAEYFRSVAKMGMHVAEALDYAHKQGILHRDIKPSNLLLDTDGTVWIADFGLAKGEETDELTHTGDVVGTLRYMAPERFQGLSDSRGDVYALGITLYELLALRPAFEESSRPRLIARITQDDPQRPRKLDGAIPRDLETIVLKAICKEPPRRYQTAKELADDLRRFLAGEAVWARRVGIWERTGKWIKRRPAAAALLAVSVTALLVLIAGILVHDAQLGAALAAEAKRRAQTRDVLEMLTSQVIDEWLARQQELLPEHRDFLEKAVGAYEELARDTGQEEASRAGVALALQRVGNIRMKLGQMAEAEAAYVRSRDLYQLLADDFPAAPSYRQELASSHNNLGLLMQSTGRAQDAEEPYRQALTLRQQLVADFPAVPSYRSDLAGIQNNLGILLLQDTGHAQDAEKAFREALRLQQQLAADFPAVPIYREYLTNHYNNLGILLKDTGRAQDAEKAFREGLKLRRQLVADFPTVPRYRHGLALSHSNLGLLLQNAGRARDAENALREALNLQQQLAADFPTVPEYREVLATVHTNLGLLWGTGQAQDAEHAYRAALKLRQQLAADFPNVPDYRNGLAGTMVNLANLLSSSKPGLARQLLEQAEPHHRAALQAKPHDPTYRQFFRNNRWWLGETLVNLGDHAAAANVAAQLIQAAVDQRVDVYHAASIWARCVALAERDPRLTEAQRQERAKAHGDQAMAALRQVVQNGFKDVAQMKKDSDLDALRPRPDFQRLLAELQATAPSGPK